MAGMNGEEVRYLFDKDAFFKLAVRGDLKRCGNGFFSTAEAGALKAYFIFGMLCFVRWTRSNFRDRWFFRRIPLFTCSRRRESNAPLLETKLRQPRLYLNIGVTPYCDGKTGISRVARNLVREGLLASPDVVPVYCDLIRGGYRTAVHWCRSLGMTSTGNVLTGEDAEISVSPGDWLVHLTVSAEDIASNRNYREIFLSEGGREGAILYDLIPEQFPQYVSKNSRPLFRQWLKSLAKMDGVFPISKAAQDDWIDWSREHGLAMGGAVHFFHLGADFAKTVIKASDTEQLPEALANRPYFVQVSTIEPRKGYVQLLDAFEWLWQHNEDVGLVLVGRYGWKMEAFAERVNRHRELGKRLFWLEGISDEVLSAVYEGARGVVMASEAEGFGLAVVEGLMRGKEVIARDLPVFKEIAGDAPVFFSGKEPQALAEAVKCVLQRKSGVISPRVRCLTWKESFMEFQAAVRYAEKERASH